MVGQHSLGRGGPWTASGPAGTYKRRQIRWQAGQSIMGRSRTAHPPSRGGLPPVLFSTYWLYCQGPLLPQIRSALYNFFKL